MSCCGSNKVNTGQSTPDLVDYEAKEQKRLACCVGSSLTGIALAVIGVGVVVTIIGALGIGLHYGLRSQLNAPDFLQKSHLFANKLASKLHISLRPLAILVTVAGGLTTVTGIALLMQACCCRCFCNKQQKKMDKLIYVTGNAEDGKDLQKASDVNSRSSEDTPSEIPEDSQFGKLDLSSDSSASSDD